MVSAILVVVGAGLAVAVQLAVLGSATRVWHPLSISLALQSAGLIVGGIWAVHQRTWSEAFQVSFQWWWLPVGALGWGIVAALGYATARLGVSITLSVLITAQLVAGLAFDGVIGDLQLGPRHLFGVLLLIGGVFLVARVNT